MSYNPGDIVDGKYCIIDVMGGGAMGMVYRAEQMAMNMPVALKILHGDYAESEEFRRRFQREAQAAAMLKHSNICAVLDFAMTETQDSQKKTSYLVMELLEGETLKHRMATCGRFPARVAVAIMRQLLSALHCAHQSKIVHRDVKPDNIFLIERDGTNDFVKLIDFGIAHLDNPDGDLKTLTQAGQIYGTPQYLSPEQALGDPVDFHADLYACGIIFYEMLVGEPPFDGKNYIELLHKQVSEKPPHLPDNIPQNKKLDAIIQRLLLKNPAERYDSALEVIRLLEKVQSGFASDASFGEAIKEILPQNRRQMKLFGIIIGVAALVLIIILSLIGSLFTEDTPNPVQVVKQAMNRPSDFAYTADGFGIGFDPILSKDSDITSAVRYFIDEKYDMAFALMETARLKYWEHPNFVWLYMQVCRELKDDDYRDNVINASIQLMILTENAGRNEIAREIFYDNYKKIFESDKFKEVPDKHKVSILAELILHSRYDVGRNRLELIFEQYDAVQDVSIEPWKKDAVEIWRLDKEKCAERLEILEVLLKEHKDHLKEIYEYVVMPFYKSRHTNCGRSSGFLDFSKKKDCNGCMRSRLKELIAEQATGSMDGDGEKADDSGSM